MATLLLILAWIAALLVALLALPIEFVFRASLPEPGGPLKRSVRFRWAFGLVDVPLPGRKVAREKKAKRKPKSPVRRKKSRRSRVRRLILNPAAWERAKALLTGLIHTVQWRVSRLDARFGLDDPAETGQLWGLLSTMLFMLPRHHRVLVQPVFEGPALAFDGEAAVRFVPLRVIAVLVAFGLSPATWRLLWPVVRNK